MVAVPPDTPLTTPVNAPTVATEVLLLLHAPQPVASLRVIVEPVHTTVGPVIAATGSLILYEVVFH